MRKFGDVQQILAKKKKKKEKKKKKVHSLIHRTTRLTHCPCVAVRMIPALASRT